MERQRRAMGGPMIYVHPDDAVRLGLEAGSDVEVRNERGHISAQLEVSNEVLPGVATLPGKWWSQDVGGAGPNGLTPASWTAGGEPAYNDTFVTITEVSPSPDAIDEPVV